MENKMETTIIYWGSVDSYWDNGKEHGNYYLELKRFWNMLLCTVSVI